MILVIDFGSQTTHLIARRINELGVKTEIVNPHEALSKIKSSLPKGIILSGGPSSVYGEQALLIDKELFKNNIPILGICYGLQLMSYLMGGKVVPGKKKEYGSTVFTICGQSILFENLPNTFNVWMSHFDQVIKPPSYAQVTGHTAAVDIAAFEDKERKRFGIQFHPEVQHTQYGQKILRNFVIGVCQEKTFQTKNNIEEIVNHIKDTIGMEKAVCALSEGIDSSVAAVLTHKAIGNNLTCYYVDTGFMRQNETEEVISTYQKNFHLNLKIIHAQGVFLKNLKGIIDPEKKRIIIGRIFIEIFEKAAKKEKIRYLIQGTIYPDVIESKGTKHAAKIKTNHNVGGIPSRHKFNIIEPLKLFYKDEVREIAGRLGFPRSLITRHAFPGPGLAVRIIGEGTKQKLNILRKADVIVTEEIKKAGLYNEVWMAFAILTGIKTTGVTGDERKYGETIAIRAVESKDAMTADFVRIPYDLLARISERITTEVF